MIYKITPTNILCVDYVVGIDSKEALIYNVLIRFTVG